MSTEKEKRASSKPLDDGEMTKYGVACGCAHGTPPKKEKLEKVAGKKVCPECGRPHVS